jgi:hypothetical protein
VCVIAQTAAAPGKAHQAVSLDTVVELMEAEGYDQSESRVALVTLDGRGAVKLTRECGETWLALGVQRLAEVLA